MGIGFGLAFSAMSALIVAAVPPSQTGVASGMNANIRTIGGSIGSAVMASIVTSQLAPSGLPKESGYTTGFAVMAGGLVLAALAGLLIPRRGACGRRPGEPEHAESGDARPPGRGGRRSRQSDRVRRASTARAPRRDAVRNYQRILDAAREVFGESGADACIEEIAARAGVGVGTVYRRFASKDALIDELLRLALEELMTAADRALARTDGHGLEELLRAFGQSFAEHARYANLLLERPADAAAARRIRAAIEELTARAVAAGTVRPGHHGQRRHGADLGHARARAGRGRRRARGLAALPRHPPGRHAGGRPAQQRARPCRPGSCRS